MLLRGPCRRVKMWISTTVFFQNAAHDKTMWNWGHKETWGECNPDSRAGFWDDSSNGGSGEKHGLGWLLYYENTEGLSGERHGEKCTERKPSSLGLICLLCKMRLVWATARVSKAPCNLQRSKLSGQIWRLPYIRCWTFKSYGDCMRMQYGSHSGSVTPVSHGITERLFRTISLFSEHPNWVENDI